MKKNKNQLRWLLSLVLYGGTLYLALVILLGTAITPAIASGKPGATGNVLLQTGNSSTASSKLPPVVTGATDFGTLPNRPPVPPPAPANGDGKLRSSVIQAPVVTAPNDVDAQAKARFVLDPNKVEPVTICVWNGSGYTRHSAQSNSDLSGYTDDAGSIIFVGDVSCPTPPASSSSSSSSSAARKTVVCHRTGNGYQKINVAWNSADFAGHLEHEGDIIYVGVTDASCPSGSSSSSNSGSSGSTSSSGSSQSSSSSSRGSSSSSSSSQSSSSSSRGSSSSSSGSQSTSSSGSSESTGSSGSSSSSHSKSSSSSSRSSSKSSSSSGKSSSSSSSSSSEPPSPPPPPSGQAAAAVPIPVTGGLCPIVFSSNRDGNWEIYVVNPDGTNLRRLTFHDAADLEPAWSPDCRQIAFSSDRDGNREIYVMNADGSDVHRLTNNPGEDTTPAWSPDGLRIAFRTNRSGTFKIYVMNADGTNQHRLTATPGQDGYPRWSPDGSRVVFSSTRSGNSEIYVVDADGTNLQRLTNDRAQDEAPAWSPDGSQIVFQSSRSGNWDIYTMLAPASAGENADGTGVTQLTYGAAADLSPTWSPDGSQIVFVSNRDGKYWLYIMGADGADQHLLIKSNARIAKPSVSLDEITPDWHPW